MTERLRVREIDDDEGQRLVRIVRRGTGSVVTWRRAQMVLLSAQGMDAVAIAKVAFTSEVTSVVILRPSGFMMRTRWASHKSRMMEHLHSSERLTGGSAVWGGWGSNPRPADYESPTVRRGQ